MTRAGKAFYIALSIAIGLVVQTARSAEAQDTSFSSYWTYDAPGPITLVTHADLDGNGTDEFVVATQDNSIILLSAGGRPLRRLNLEDSPPILLLTTLSTDGERRGELDILAVTEQDIRLFSNEGSPVWTQPLILPPPPASVDADDPEAVANWRTLNRPVTVTAFDRDGDGTDEILLLLLSGELQLYDSQGSRLWSYETEDPRPAGTNAYISVGDVDRNGTPEIAFAYFGGRFSKLALINGEGNNIWDRERPVDGRATALSLVGFDPQGPVDIAVGNSLGRVHVYDSAGEERWFRTPNRPVSSLASATLAGGPALLVGTETGVVAAYNAAGDRYWRSIIADTADRQVIDLSASPVVPRTNQPAVAVTLAAGTAGSQELAEVYLLDTNGLRLIADPLVSVPRATRLVDVNRDGLNELLLASFGTLALVDSGTGARKNAPAWDYRLFVAPRTVIAADINDDGKDDLLLGASDGRLHMLETDSGQQASWIQKLGDTAPLLQVLRQPEDGQALIVAVSNERLPDIEGRETFESTVHLLDNNGRDTLGPLVLPHLATVLSIMDLDGDDQQEIILGTAAGVIFGLSPELTSIWQVTVGAPVSSFLPMTGGGLYASTSDGRIFAVASEGDARLLINYNLHNVLHMLPAPAGADQPGLLVLTDDGVIRELMSDGREVWRQDLDAGTPTVVVEGGGRYLIATDLGRLFQLDQNRQLTEWELTEDSGISALSWGDLSGGGADDIAIGSRSGTISLYGEDGRAWDEQLLTSGIFSLIGVDRGPATPQELVAVTDLGVVQLYEAKANRPPLLFDPRVEVQPGSYQISLDVLEEAGDTVQVQLETWDSETGSWILAGTRSVDGSERISFSILPTGSDPVRYRFLYSDQSHAGIIEPPPGPVPERTDPWTTIFLGTILVGLVGLTAVIIIRQALSPDTQSRRLYRRIKQQPESTLKVIAAAYGRSSGAPGMLLGLANRAREEQDLVLANLVDGIFLLAARPEAGLAIVSSALDHAHQQGLEWRDLDDWRTMFRMAQMLHEAPNVTELSLLRPQLLQSLPDQITTDESAPGMSVLLPALTSLADSERVDMAEDRLYYLHEASVLLRQVQEDLEEQPVDLVDRLAFLIALRWQGLVNAAVEELRGQAQLIVMLKTRRLAPKEEETTIVLEIANIGRARAENMEILLDQSTAYDAPESLISIPVLTPGRSREISFALKLNVHDRFRLSCGIQYDDRSQKKRRMAFGDMVHLLPQVREFSPIPNPYLPGTPLREYSTLFYGREELFEFIAQNANRLAQRNVLILVGQRRTGKTSALLRLRTHLPDGLLPVYIDCQALGVVPGMAALFHDLAWLVADALSLREIELEVPEPAVWHEDPAGYFQRRFLPQVRKLLPADTTLLLVFDEFEAFENLVRDGILPPTFFTYLRHLMQHSHGLSFVFVGTRRLEEMSTDYWSVLFNIALYRHIGFLSREAATRLICEPVAPYIVFDDLALDKIWRVTAGHPYFLQLVCYTLINQANAKRDGYVTISDVNSALAEMLRLGEVHFAYIWQRSTFTERALLAAVAHLMDRDVPFHPADLVQYLEQFGFRFDPAELTDGLTGLVEREIMQEVTVEGTTLYELKIGLVGLWAEQNKSLSKLYASKDAALIAAHA